jgi:hypothetical protein
VFSAFTSLLSCGEYTLTVETRGFHQLTSTSQHMLVVEKIFHKILKQPLEDQFISRINLKSYVLTLLKAKNLYRILLMTTLSPTKWNKLTDSFWELTFGSNWDGDLPARFPRT